MDRKSSAMISPPRFRRPSFQNGGFFCLFSGFHLTHLKFEIKTLLTGPFEKFYHPFNFSDKTLLAQR